MKRTLFITMLLCLFAVVANAQTQDVGVQGGFRYYQSGSTSWDDLKVGGEDPREYTEIGVRRSSRIEIQITEPATGACAFSMESGTGRCSILTQYNRYALIDIPDRSWSSSTPYSTLHITCGDKYLEVRIYVTN